MSDDGLQALTIIWFVGSVFSPYYAWARRHGSVDPRRHCAVNIALYGRGSRWAMTERSERSLWLAERHLRIGPSTFDWRDDGAHMVLNEWGFPLPRRIVGRVRLHREGKTGSPLALDPAGRHVWHPLWPMAAIEVELEQPAIRWRGHAYVDHNHGSRPLAEDFVNWHWARARAGDTASIQYGALRRDGTRLDHHVSISANGAEQLWPGTSWKHLPGSAWGIRRQIRDGGSPTVIRTLEDTPFYARTLVRASDGSTTVQESLDLDRFSSPWVQAMLPFRMPRR